MRVQMDNREKKRGKHLSDFAIDLKLYADEASEDDLRHLESCEECSAILDNREEEKRVWSLNADNSFLEKKVDLEIVIGVKKSWFNISEIILSYRMTSLISASIISLLIIFGIYNFLPSTTERSKEELSINIEEFTSKGGIGLMIYDNSSRGGHKLHPGDHIRVGTRLRFGLRLLYSGHIMIVGVDQTHSVFLYYPIDEAKESTFMKKKSEILPGAIEMDNTPGREWFIALSCPEPFSFNAVNDKIQDLPESEFSGWVRKGPPHLFNGCHQTFYFLDKPPLGDVPVAPEKE